MSNGNNATAAKAPYRLTRWAGDFITLGSFSTFAEALTAYAYAEPGNKGLINDDLRDEGSGLTDAELDAVYSLPMTRAATPEELAAALEALQ